PGVEGRHVSERSAFPLIAITPSQFKDLQYQTFWKTEHACSVNIENGNGASHIGTRIASASISPIQHTGNALSICENIQRMIVQMKQAISTMVKRMQILL